MSKFFSPVIRRWPTVVQFALEVGCPERSAREWLRIDSIPAPWFNGVVRAAEERGFADIDHRSLAGLAERRRTDGEQAKNRLDQLQKTRAA